MQRGTAGTGGTVVGMVSYKAVCKILDDLDKERSWDLSEADQENPANVNSILDAFERAHQTFSDRYRIWVNNGTVGRWPDHPDDDPDEDTDVGTCYWFSPTTAPQTKNGIEQIRHLLLGPDNVTSLFEIIRHDRTLSGNINYSDRGEALFLFLSAWGRYYRHIRIQDARLERIFTDNLHICADEGSAENIVDRLADREILIRREEHAQKRRGVGVRANPFVYWVPNREFYEKFRGPAAAYLMMNNLPAIIEIVATLQLDRDAALETLNDHGLLDDYKQRRALAEMYRKPIVLNYIGDDELEIHKGS